MQVFIYMYIRGGSGGRGGSMRKTRKFTARLAHYSDAAHVFIRITASCSANIERSNMQLPRDSCLKNTKADTIDNRVVTTLDLLSVQIRGTPDESPKLYSSCHKLCVVVVVSDDLRSSLTYHAIMNTSTFGVQKSMKGPATVKEIVVSEVARVEYKISLHRTRPSKNIYVAKGRAPATEREN